METQVLLVLCLPVGKTADAKDHGDGEALEKALPQPGVLPPHGSPWAHGGPGPGPWGQKRPEEAQARGPLRTHLTTSGPGQTPWGDWPLAIRDWGCIDLFPTR